MSSVVVVDSACDLPASFIERNPVKVLPLNLTLDGVDRVDNLSPGQKIELFQSGALTRGHDAESAPATADQIYQYYLDEVVPNFDFAVGQSVSRTRSPTFDNWLSAQGNIQRDYRAIREKAGVQGHFGMRVINSGTMFAGQGLLAIETVRMFKAKSGKNELRQSAESFKEKILTFAVPKELSYLRERARKKGDKSVSFISAFIGKALDISPILRGSQDVTEPVAKVRGFDNALDKLFSFAIDKIKEGLACPYIVISVADDPGVLLRYESYSDLKDVAKKHGVEVLSAVMSMSGGINLGPGTVSLALATDNHDYKF